MKSNRTGQAGWKAYVDKADQSVADLAAGGELVREQVMQFMAISIVGSRFRELCTTKIMSRDTIEFPKMTTMGTRVWWPASEYQALPLARRVAPGFSKTELTVREIMCTYKYPKHVLKINVEDGQFQNTVLAYLGQHSKRDWEELAIRGDTVAGSDATMQLFNGIIAGTTTYTAAAGGVALSETFLRTLRFTQPVEFRQQENLAFFTSEEAQDAHRREIGARMTAAGDQHELQRAPVTYHAGKAVYPIPLFPTTIGGNQTVVMYMDPKNFAIGIRENMELDTDWNPETRSYTVVGVAWVTQGLLHEPYACKGTGVLST